MLFQSQKYKMLFSNSHMNVVWCKDTNEHILLIITGYIYWKVHRLCSSYWLVYVLSCVWCCGKRAFLCSTFWLLFRIGLIVQQIVV